MLQETCIVYCGIDVNDAPSPCFHSANLIPHFVREFIIARNKTGVNLSFGC
jgi:hypothetical protein